MAAFAEMEQNFSPLHACERLKQILPQHQMYPVRHDPGIYLDRMMASQPLGPLGPTAQDHRMITGMQNEDLILS